MNGANFGNFPQKYFHATSIMDIYFNNPQLHNRMKTCILDIFGASVDIIILISPKNSKVEKCMV